MTENMITRERLKGAYSEGEALAIYNEARADGSLREFCQRFMYDEDYQVRSEEHTSELQSQR